MKALHKTDVDHPDNLQIEDGDIISVMDGRYVYMAYMVHIGIRLEIKDGDIISVMDGR